MANTPAGPQVTGALALYAGVGPGHAMRFLGYGPTGGLRWKMEYGWVPFFTDLGGPVISFDEVYASQQAYVSIDLNYFRQDTLLAVEAMGNPSGISMVDPFGDIGTMALGEGVAYPLTIVFPYAAKPALRVAGMPAGITFFASILVGPSGYKGGTFPRDVNLIWKCKSIFNKANGSFTLGQYGVPAGLPPAA